MPKVFSYFNTHLEDLDCEFGRIANLDASGESKTLKFKETNGVRREGAVSAFLNQGGGARVASGAALNLNSPLSVL